MTEKNLVLRKVYISRKLDNILGAEAESKNVTRSDLLAYYLKLGIVTEAKRATARK